VGLAKIGTGEEEPAIAPGDAGDAALAVAPIVIESERLDIVGDGSVDAGNGDLGNGGAAPAGRPIKD
jgi:hypothetical protein